MTRGVSSEPPVEWTLSDLTAVLIRRRLWIIAAVAAALLLAFAYGLAATPRYRATAVIEVQRQSRGAFGLDNATADRPSTEIDDSFDENLALQTEIGILRSDAVTLDVIRRTGLENTPDYFGPRRGRFAWMRRLAFRRMPLEPLSTPLSEAPNRRYAALRIFAKHSRIAALPGTRLIAVSYTDPDPRRAAQVANALVAALSDYNFRARSSAASQSATWLQAQLASLKQQTDALDARAAALDRASGDFGDSGSHNPVLARLDQLNAALAQAESGRIVREAIWRAAQSGDPDLLSGLGGDPGAGPNTQNALALLQSLRAQQSTAQAQLAAFSNRYGDNWPAVAEQRSRLAAIQQSIHDELHRLSERARTDYQVSLQSENAARAAFDQQKALASRLTGDAVALRLTRQEADESRTLYTSLLGRLQQTGVLEGLHSGNFTLVARALVPPPDHPSNPRLPLLLALGLCAGLTLGSAAAVVRELTDQAVRSPADLEALPDAPVFGALPSAARAEPWYRRIRPTPPSRPLAPESEGRFEIPAPGTAFTDSLYRLCVSLFLPPGDDSRVISVTSPGPGAARSAARSATPLAFSLAAVLAQHGHSVLFVDADLHSAPSSSEEAGVPPGFSETVSGDDAAVPHNPCASLPQLAVLSSGSRPPTPSGIISPLRVSRVVDRWRKEFSFILFNCPSAACADALVLAQLSDAVLLAARAGHSRKDHIAPAIHSLRRQMPAQAVLGLVLHGVPPGGPYAVA